MTKMIRIEDKRRIPAAYILKGEFLLTDQVDWKNLTCLVEMETIPLLQFDYERTVLEKSGNRGCDLPKDIRSRNNIKEAILIALAQDYAQRNYENGMDTIIECWSDYDWLAFIKREGFNWKRIKAAMDSLAAIWMERKADADYHRRQAIGAPEDEQLVKDNPEVEKAFRQAMKDYHGQPYLFDYQLDMTVKEAREEIHHMTHAND